MGIPDRACVFTAARLVLFQLRLLGGEKRGLGCGLPAPKQLFLRSQDSIFVEEVLVQTFPNVLPAPRSIPEPSFQGCCLLLQNVKLFKKTFNFLCCCSVSIVN